MSRFATAVFVLIGLLFTVPAGAQSFEDLVQTLPEGNFAERGAVVDAMAATGDERALAILEALS
jgi:urea transport system permease protein